MNGSKKSSHLSDNTNNHTRDNSFSSDKSGDYSKKFMTFKQAKIYWENKKEVELGMQLM